MDIAKKKIPKLRFSEFNSHWALEKLNSHIELLSGFAFKGDDISEDNNGIPILRGINITEGYIRHNPDIDRFYTKSISKLNKYLLKKDDLVLGMDGSKVGKNVALITKKDEGSLLIQRVARIRAKSSSDIRYIFLNIFSYRFHKYVDVVNTSSGIPHISAKQIKEFEIGFPSKPEQQKIASFFSSVDKKLDQLQKKKELLEKYKKGMMQKVFKQKVRFKDENGKDFPEWVEKKLGQISKNIGYGIGASATTFDGENKYLRITDIDEHTNKFKPKPLTSPEGKIDKKYFLKENDLLFARTGASVGKTYIYSGNDGKLVFAGFLIKFSIVNQNSRFIFYTTLTQRYQKWIEVMSMRSGQPGINAEELKGFKLKLPCVEEQTKIANFLSSIDDKIDLVTTEIEKANQFKKGLLQQMFV